MQHEATTVILGGSGVAGTGIVRGLLAAGHSVDVIDLRPPDLFHPRLRFIEADIRAPKVLERITQYDHVVVAFGLLARGLAETPRAAHEFNLEVTSRVVEAARSGRCRRFVFLSSAMVYDRNRAAGALAEDAPLGGTCLYTHSKLAIEHLLHCAVSADLAPTLILRPFTLFGPGPLRGAAGHLVGRWLELARAGEPLTIHGDGSQVVDLVPSALLAAACLRFFSEAQPRALRVLNATVGKPTTLGALADLFRERFAETRIVSVQPPTTATASGRSWGDGTALHAYLGATLPDPATAMRTFLAEK